MHWETKNARNSIAVLALVRQFGTEPTYLQGVPGCFKTLVHDGSKFLV